MKKIGLNEIEDIAIGAALLGSGGGGDPYIGKLIAMQAIKECGEVTLIQPNEVPNDEVVLPIAMMGAPTVLVEKGINGKEYQTIFDGMSNYLGKKIYAIMPMEVGGVNSLLPVAAAARLGLPLVDCDGMGRAFPELQMVTFTMGGIKATPLAFADEKGNSGIIETISNKWTEELARAIAMTCGAAISVCLYPVTGKEIKEYSVQETISYSAFLGKTIRQAQKEATNKAEEFFIKESSAFILFKGKISDVLRENKGGFNLGKILMEGMDGYSGRVAEVEFQNENLIVRVNGQVKVTTPDLITLIDTDTFVPIPTDALKYGKRAFVVGFAAHPLWRTKEGIELVGPRYFGYDVDYVPIEERVKERENV